MNMKKIMEIVTSDYLLCDLPQKKELLVSVLGKLKHEFLRDWLVIENLSKETICLVHVPSIMAETFLMPFTKAVGLIKLGGEHNCDDELIAMLTENPVNKMIYAGWQQTQQSQN
jgi:hypothetical protein